MARALAAAFAHAHLLPTLGVILLVTAVTGTYLLLRGHGHLAYETLAWGLFVPLGFTGWGSALARVLAKRSHFDLGLRCVWGMAFLAFLGALLALLHACNRTMLFALIVTGAAILPVDALLFARKPSQARRLRFEAGFMIGAAALFFVALLQYAAALDDIPKWASADDFPAYYVFPKELLDTGSSFQPYSIRRILAWGAQSLYQAFFLSRAPFAFISLFDRGICLLVLLALIAGTPVPKRVPRALLLAPMFVVLLLQPWRSNSTSEVSGAVILFGLFRTIMAWPTHARTRWPAATTTALLVVAAWALRPNYGFVALLMVFFSHAAILAGRWRARRTLSREDFVEPLSTLSLVALFAAPWMIASYATFHTPLFPALWGNYRPGSHMFGVEIPLGRRLRLMLEPFFAEQPIAAIGIFMLAYLATRDPQRRRPVDALCLASFLGICALVYTFPRTYAADQARYYFAYQLASVLAVLVGPIAAARHADRLTARAWLGIVLTTMAAFVQVQTSFSPGIGMYAQFVRKVDNWMETMPPPADDLTRGTPYAALQSAIPVGATVATLVEEPFRLDYARNRIYVLDFPGVVAKGGHLSVQEGGERFARDLVAQGVRYLLIVDPGRGHFYSRSAWLGHQRDDATLLANTDTTPLFLGAFDAIDELRRTRRNLATLADMTVLDLQERTPIP